MRVSATDIDAFRRYRNTEDADLGELIAQLRRQGEPSEAMLAGSALHKALELVEDGEHDYLQADGYTFDLTECDAALPLPNTRELKATREYLIDGEPVTLVGVGDVLGGKRVEDHKMTGQFDAERFLSTYQWRIYLELFDADTFQWNVFEARELKPKLWKVFNFHTLRAYRYPGIGEDVKREIRLFLDFARIHLPERIERAVAA